MGFISLKSQVHRFEVTDSLIYNIHHTFIVIFYIVIAEFVAHLS